MAVEKFETINIKGKEYVTVNERLKFFRNNFPEHSLTTEIVKSDGNSILMEAKIANKDGVVLATGFAYEEKQSSYINKTSYVENCETSAWGRALGNFGIGIDETVCTADELLNALKNQGSETENAPRPAEKKKTAPVAKKDAETQKTIGKKEAETMAELAHATGTPLETILQFCEAKNIAEVTRGKYEQAMKVLMRKSQKQGTEKQNQTTGTNTEREPRLDDLVDARDY